MVPNLVTNRLPRHGGYYRVNYEEETILNDYFL
jgi:hypothetical protein